MTNATTIDEVISQLNELIKTAITENNRMGYFAALYKRMTIAVKDGITNNLFEDPARMERLDVIFANRYLQAWDAYRNGRPCSPAWRAAFESTKQPKLIVLQHIIAGINVHINLDLCIAAVDTCRGSSIDALKNDFDKINQIIALQAKAVQECLTKIWFPLRLITSISQHSEDAVLNFSIETARKCSWANALILAKLSLKDQERHLAAINVMVEGICSRIANPGIMLTFVLRAVNAMENKTVGNNIKLL